MLLRFALVSWHIDIGSSNKYNLNIETLVSPLLVSSSIIIDLQKSWKVIAVYNSSIGKKLPTIEEKNSNFWYTQPSYTK